MKQAILKLLNLSPVGAEVTTTPQSYLQDKGIAHPTPKADNDIFRHWREQSDIIQLGHISKPLQNKGI